MHKPTILHVFFVLALLFVAGCSRDNDDGKSYIQLSNPISAIDTAGVNKQKIMARENDTIADTTPAAITSFTITIKDTNDNQISKDTFGESGTIKLVIPSNIALIISGSASTNNETSYFGEVTINSVRPGATSRLSLLLYNTNSGSDPISVEFPLGSATDPTATLTKSKGSAFSRDNNFVLFFSDDANLANNNATNLFLRTFSDTAENNTITNLHTNNAGDAATGGNVTEADISADGVYVVFSSTATDLVPDDTNEAADIFLKNTITGAIKRLSTPAFPSTTAGLNSYNPQISDDGNTITFFSEAEIIDSTTNTLFIYNRLNDDIVPTSIAGISDNYRLSGDGKVIVYQTRGLEENGLMLTEFIIPTSTPSVSKKTTAVTGRSTDTLQKISISNANYNFSVSQTGQYTAFIPDTNVDGLLKNQIYLYNRDTKKRSLLSKSRSNKNFKGELTQTGAPALSNDGRYIVFSYDNIIYIRNIEFDNLKEIDAGSNPFISVNGDKIGYEVEGKLFVIENPLYVIPTAPITKTIAPINFSLTDNADGSYNINLNWGAVANASYYRIYQSFDPDIASKLDDPAFSPIIRETTDTNLTFDLSDFAEENNSIGLYFAILAIDENGEGSLSTEIAHLLKPTLFDVSSNLEDITVISTLQEIHLFFTKKINIQTLYNALNITDAQSNSVGFFVTSLTNTSAIISPYYNNSTTYTLTIDQQLETLTAEKLPTDYVVTFNTALYFNEGTVTAPLSIPDNYVGVVTDEGKSYYALPVPTAINSNQSYVIRLKDNSTLLSYSVVGRQGESINCIKPQMCIIENANPNSVFDITVDGSQTIDGGSDFTLAMSEINIIDGTNTKTRSFTAKMGKAFGYVWIKNLELGSQYNLTDSTLSYGTYYSMASTLPSSSLCYIFMYMGEGNGNQCRFASSNEAALGEIFLEFDASDGRRFNHEIRSYQLDVVRTRTFVQDGVNSIELTDEKFVEFTSLDPSLEYYLVISTGTGGSAYTISKGIDFNYPTCEGKLDIDTNNFDSCVFTASYSGTIQIKLDDLATSMDGYSVKATLNELTPALISELTISNASINVPPGKQIVFGTLSDAFNTDGQGPEWLKVKLTSDTTTEPAATGSITTYNSLNSPSCKSELNHESASCEVRNDPNSLIVIELNKTDAPYKIMASSFTEDSIGTGISISPERYFSATPFIGSINATTLIKAVVTTEIDPTSMQVFSFGWDKDKGNTLCASIRIGNNLLCITDSYYNVRQNPLLIKIFDNHAQITENDTTLVDLTVETITEEQLTVGSITTGQSNDDYVIYGLNNLYPSIYSISVTGTKSPVPFYIVSSYTDKLVCKSTSLDQNQNRHNCTSIIYGGFIVIDTSYSSEIGPIDFSIEIINLTPDIYNFFNNFEY